MLFLKAGTSPTVKVGPFVDAADGLTALEALVIQKADVRLSKNGGNFAAASADQGASDAGAAHDELGYYDISLDTTDTGTVGRLVIVVQMFGESGDPDALPVRHEFMVLPAQVYDSLVAGSDTLDVQVAGLDAAALAAIADELEMEADTAQGGTSSTITLASGASPTNDHYNDRNARVFIRAGTGAGQDRAIVDYVGSTRVATVSPEWTTSPDATSVYVITFV